MSAGQRNGGVHPGLDKPLVIDVAWDSTEQPVEFPVCGHRLNQDQRERIQVGRVDPRLPEAGAEPGHDLGLRPCDEPVIKLGPLAFGEQVGLTPDEAGQGGPPVQRGEIPPSEHGQLGAQVPQREHLHCRNPDRAAQCLDPRSQRYPADDVIPRLCATEDVTDDEAAELSMFLLFAGHETTVVQIGFTALLLMANPWLTQSSGGHSSTIPI